MKKTLRFLSLFLAIVMIFTCLPAISAERVSAATKSVEPCYNGKWTYYAIYGTIYKFDSTTGKDKVLKDTKSWWVSNIAYYNGYLYFDTDFAVGTGTEESYVCKMKADGTGFKKLARGFNTKVYDGRIYYTRVSHNAEGGWDDVLGLGSMSLDGKDKKSFLKGVGTYSLENGSIIYSQYSSGTNVIKAYDINANKSKTVKKHTDSPMMLGADDGSVYYYCENRVFKYDVSSGKVTKSKTELPYGCFGPKDGKIYYGKYENNNTYYYDFKTGKSTKLLTGKRLAGVYYSKSGYNVYTRYYSQEESEKVNWEYDIEDAAMKIDGKGYKVLHKYYVS